MLFRSHEFEAESRTLFRRLAVPQVPGESLRKRTSEYLNEIAFSIEECDNLVGNLPEAAGSVQAADRLAESYLTPRRATTMCGAEVCRRSNFRPRDFSRHNGPRRQVPREFNPATAVRRRRRRRRRQQTLR